MARHGCKRHQKAIAAPRAVPIHRKKHTFLKKTRAGPHSAADSASIIVVIRNLLHAAKNLAEAKSVLNRGLVLVDARVVKNASLPVGLMDVISFPSTNAYRRVVFKKEKITLQPIPKNHAGWKYCKVKGKKIVRKGKIQLALHDGRTLIVEKEEARFSVGDTLKIKLPKQEVAKFLKLEKNALCYVSHGKHSGEIARLSELLPNNNVKLLTANGEEHITVKKYLFVVDEDFAQNE